MGWGSEPSGSGFSGELACLHGRIKGVLFVGALRAYLLQQGEKVYVGAMLLDRRPERCEVQRCWGRGSRSLCSRFAQLEEDPLGAPRRRAEYQEPARLRPDVLIGVHDAAGNVDEGALPCRKGAAVADELMLALQDVEGLILLVVQVGQRFVLRRDGLLEECECPAGVLPSA